MALDHAHDDSPPLPVDSDPSVITSSDAAKVESAGPAARQRKLARRPEEWNSDARRNG